MTLREAVRAIWNGLTEPPEPKPETPEEIAARGAELAVTLFETERPKFVKCDPFVESYGLAAEHPLGFKLECYTLVSPEWHLQINGIGFELTKLQQQRLQRVVEDGKAQTKVGAAMMLAQAIVARGVTEQNNS